MLCSAERRNVHSRPWACTVVSASTAVTGSVFRAGGSCPCNEYISGEVIWRGNSMGML